MRLSLLLVVALPASAQEALNPGSLGSPPGPGCETGTSGCFPSAPPGPVTPPADPGSTSENPPPVVDPKNVPYYGVLPGASTLPDQPILSPDAQRQLQQQELEQQRQQQQEALARQEEERQRQAEHDQRMEELMARQNELLEQQLETQPSPAPEIQ